MSYPILDPEAYEDAATAQAALDVRRLINKMGFGDEVLDALIRLLIDAWIDGGKWHTKLMVASQPDPKNIPPEVIAMSAKVLGYRKKDDRA